jgi:hypothetical protein
MRSLVLFLCLFASASAWAGIGNVAESTGAPGEITRGKDKVAGTKGAGIESNDIYTTKNGSVQLSFVDDTKVKITENSRLLIDDFVFDPKKSDAGKLALKVGMGTVRYASGQIAKTNAQQVAIKTPTASVAVRGTDFTMTVDETGQSLIVLVPSCKEGEKVKEYELEENKCRVGSIEVETLAGKVVLDHAFQGTFVASSNLPPTPPVVINMTESKISNNLIIVKPMEIIRAINNQSGKSKREMEQEQEEQEQARKLSEAIKKDRDFLKSILEGEDYEDMSKGEVALIVARALAEPGPIANKIKVANELAIPVIRSKRKEDRELTLEAYKTYREKEIEDIKAGKATDLEKQVRAMTDAYMRANKEDKRGRDVIYNEMFEKRLGEEKSLDKSRLVGFTGIQQQLESKVNAVRKAEADKAIGKKIDEEVLKENKAFIESVKSRYPDFYKANFPELRANGGRIGYAEGTLEPTENNQIESTPTPEDAGTQQSQLKPVVKLSFQELRSRLPKEITNDIVGLISNSEQALQDFAYIKTQQDVNNFNIKYGVNLVLPSNR